MMASSVLKFSVTEMPQFRRLVGFLYAVETYADTTDDYELKSMVEECFEDLLRRHRGDS